MVAFPHNLLTDGCLIVYLEHVTKKYASTIACLLVQNPVLRVYLAANSPNKIQPTLQTKSSQLSKQKVANSLKSLWKILVICIYLYAK